MMRTELIPQVESGVDIGSGKKYYHFSLSVDEDGLPNVELEHQIAFFEVPAPFAERPQKIC
jgi:hypothetical protein